MKLQLSKYESAIVKILNICVLLLFPFAISLSYLPTSSFILYTIIWLIILGGILLFACILLMIKITPKFLTIAKTFYGATVIGITSTIIIIISNSQANHFLYSVFHYPPEHLPTTSALLTLGFSILNWLHLISYISLITLFFTIIIYSFTIPNQLANTLKFTGISLVGLVILTNAIALAPELFNTQLVMLTKMSALSFDYYPTNNLLKTCNGNRLYPKYDQFIQADPNHYSVYQTGKKIFRLIDCRQSKAKTFNL